MIDWTRVDELRGEVGDADFGEIAALFLTELADLVETLEGIGDANARRDGFHGLKGAALNLGFAEVAQAAAAGEAEPASADLAAIRAACEASSQALRSRHPGIVA